MSFKSNLTALNNSFVRWNIPLINNWTGTLYATANLINGAVTLSGEIVGTNATSATFCAANVSTKQAYAMKQAVVNLIGSHLFAVSRDTEQFAIVRSVNNSGNQYFAFLRGTDKGIYLFSLGYVGATL